MGKGAWPLGILGGLALAGVVAYALAPREIGIYFLPLSALLAVLAAGLVMWNLHRSKNSLEQRLEEMAKHISREPIETLKLWYLDIYHLYLQLSEREKRRYFSAVMQVRQHLEEAMAAEKKVETLLADAEEKSLSGLKKLYDEVHAEFTKLPQKTQAKHYPHLIHLRQRMEKGVPLPQKNKRES